MFSSRVKSHGEAVIWECSGALDGYSAADARSSLDNIPAASLLVIDLTDCFFVDGGGLRILEQAVERSGASDVVIKVADPSVLQSLRISGLGERCRLQLAREDAEAARIRRIRSSRRQRLRSRYSGFIQTHVHEDPNP